MDASHDGIAVVFVTSKTSGAGRRMDSVLARLELQHRADEVRVLRIDVDEQPELARCLDVREIPSIVMVKRTRQFARLPGRATFAELERALGTHSVSPELERP